MAVMALPSRASVLGGRPATRIAESPRPMPHTVRLPYIELSVAKVEAVTSQVRVPGLVTIGPTTRRSVWSRMRLWMTKGSCHSTAESNVQPWVKPLRSARRIRSTTSAAGGSVWRTRPNSMGTSPLTGPGGVLAGAARGSLRVS